MVNGEVIHGYDAYGRRTELRTASGSRTFTYDVQNRVASIGNSGGSLHYTYRSGLQQLDTASWRNGEGAELNSRTFAYDSYHRLTGIKLNGVSEVDYTLNDRDQRTAVQYPGVSWNYGYDDKGQLTGAEKSAGDVSETYSYTYDGIGNRLTAQEGASQFSYTSNLLNQYTQVNTAQPTYDADGNMLTTGDGWTYAWNGENRLVRAEKDGTVVEMNYDYVGRRFEKKVYVNSEAGTPGTLQHHYKYVYDGYKLVELYDNDTLLVSFTWQPESVGGLDVPVSMTYAGNTYSYVTDGNKNVTALLDAAGFRGAGYTYGPFGQVLSMDGALAEVNPFRFSSEFHDDETGLVYYNYRYYSPSLGRWTKRDPIEEESGVNLYALLGNTNVNGYDLLGLADYNSLVQIFFASPQEVTFHAEIISKIVTDDAGRKCCEDDLQVIELRVQAKPEGFPLTNYGHAFIATPNMAYGAYANLDSSLVMNLGLSLLHTDIVLQGEVRDDSEHAYDIENSYAYWACPETIKRVEAAMLATKNSFFLYSFTNKTNRNCFGQACEWLVAGGLCPPVWYKNTIIYPMELGKKIYFPGFRPKIERSVPPKVKK